MYSKNVVKTKEKRESNLNWRNLHDNQPKESLKHQWYTRPQPAIQKFTDIVAKYTPASGHLRDDPDIDLYSKSMKLLNSNQVTDGLPKILSTLMQTYFFLSTHSKF